MKMFRRILIYNYCICADKGYINTKKRGKLQFVSCLLPVSTERNSFTSYGHKRSESLLPPLKQFPVDFDVRDGVELNDLFYS